MLTSSPLHPLREKSHPSILRATGDVLSATCYPNEAADYFGENYAHRLRWAHAVNSLRVLRSALRSNAHFLEADVSAGTLMEEKTEGVSILVARCGKSWVEMMQHLDLQLGFRHGSGTLLYPCCVKDADAFAEMGWESDAPRNVVMMRKTEEIDEPENL